MNVILRDKGAKLLTHITGYRSRVYKLVLFFLVVILAMIIISWTTSEHIGEPEIILSPEIITLIPKGSDDTFVPVLPSTLAAVQAEPSSDGSANSASLQVAEASAMVPILHSLKGISLYDNTEAVVAKKGYPLSFVQDPHLKEAFTYEYPDMNIGFQDDIVTFVQIPAKVGHVQINDQRISLTITDVKRLLGEPDFVAEDGIIFQRDEKLIKLFIAPETQELIAIDYYDLSST
ncbi:hypothetical protein [Paenibacillus sp. Soil787]|uniref:hypothetical protein n=1 Tax=Paenibacillus sp. Soil787 TaxID=1736411 RepID=UPI000702BCCD|nr:hypothetical protein [Paenibacillus sp. Soil787]KRF30147.1 hypothetical protein ASG93_27885 [Paenibacillus sp. Soil787]